MIHKKFIKLVKLLMLFNSKCFDSWWRCPLSLPSWYSMMMVGILIQFLLEYSRLIVQHNNMIRNLLSLFTTTILLFRSVILDIFIWFLKNNIFLFNLYYVSLNSCITILFNLRGYSCSLLINSRRGSILFHSWRNILSIVKNLMFLYTFFFIIYFSFNFCLLIDSLTFTNDKWMI